MEYYSFADNLKYHDCSFYEPDPRKNENELTTFGNFSVLSLNTMFKLEWEKICPILFAKGCFSIFQLVKEQSFPSTVIMFYSNQTNL